jgi:hypothetical protein
MSEAAGQSVAYGVDATPFAIEDNSTHSEEFSPSVATIPDETSTFGLLAIGSLSLLGAHRSKFQGGSQVYFLNAA